MKRKIQLKALSLMTCLLCSINLTAIEAYTNYTPEDSTLTFYYDDLRSTRTGNTYNLNTGNYDPGWVKDNCNEKVTQVVFDSSFADAAPSTTAKWFIGMSKLRSITGMENNLNTGNVENMNSMFYNCWSLTSLDVSNFNTINVCSMKGMFYYCCRLTSLDVSHFITDSLFTMNSMFANCYGLTNLDVSNFNTHKVNDMYCVFWYCSALTSLDVSNFNTEKVECTAGMFGGCQQLTNLYLINFNTAKVNRMDFMFYNCPGLTVLNLNSFNTSKVKNMEYMFGECPNLKTISVDKGWDTETVTTSDNMFLNCTSLVGDQGTTYDPDHVDVTYAHIDGGPSNPGYFTEKLPTVLGDINSDDLVTIADVSSLIDILLNGDTAPSTADVNFDGRTSINDVSALIDYLLTGTWE